MGKAVLFARLAAKDLRRHLSEACAAVLVIAAAATTLTLGLVLHGETEQPLQHHPGRHRRPRRGRQPVPEHLDDRRRSPPTPTRPTWPPCSVHLGLSPPDGLPVPLGSFPGSILGVPLGIALVQTVGKSSDAYKHASIPILILVILGTWLLMSVLTAIPARIGTRLSTAQILQAESG